MAAVPREYPDYVFAWIGRNIFFTDGGAGGVPVTGAQVSTGFMIPRNAVIVQVIIAVSVTFNAATTNTLDIGSAALPTFISGAQPLTAGINIAIVNTTTTGGIISPTADTEIFTRYNFTGANPTAGLGRIAIKYIVDPDRRK